METHHSFRKWNRRPYLSGRSGGRGAQAAVRRRCGILFVGAEGKMEMEKVPALGYRIVGLPIAGLQRRLDWHNLAVPFKAVKSIRMAKRIIRDFGADAVVGFGGYASAPVLWSAQQLESADRRSGAELLRGVTRTKSCRRGRNASARPTRAWIVFPAARS